MSIIDITPDLRPTDDDPGPAPSEWDMSQAPGPEPLAAAATPAAPDEAERPGGATHVPGTRPSFTITEAATACGVSRKTITRKLTDLAEYGAAKDEDGVWRIPVEALLAVGLHPGRSLPANPRPAALRAATPTPTRAAEPQVSVPAPARGVSVTDVDVVTIPRDRWDDMRLRLARAEAEASERALALADARLALRALTAGPTGGSVEVARPRSDDAPSLPTAVGWVMGAPPHPAPSASPGATSLAGPAGADPPAALPIAVAPAEPARKRRWWQSSTR